MKKFMRYALLSAVLSLTVTSCTVYHPQSVDIPLINHAGDVRIDASLGTSVFVIPDAININATGSFGINDWLAAQLHLNYGGDNYYGQIAPGVYFPLGQNSVFEVYAGMGYGGAERDDVSAEYSERTTTGNNYSFSGHYMLPFAQGNIGWHDLTGAHFDIALGMKVGAFMPDFHYYEVNNGGNEIANTAQDYTTTNLLLEPQVMLRLGSQPLKFNVKFGVAWMNDLSESSNKFIYDIVTASAGLTFSF